jgi:hypothetical protein
MTGDKAISKISVVVPVCERVEHTLKNYHEYRSAIEALGQDFEFIYAINHQFSDIADALRDIARDDNQLKLLELSRDYGEGTVLQAAFDHVTGDSTLILPPYKQVDLNELPKMFEALKTADVVLATRWPRLDSKFKQTQTRVFSNLLRKLTNQKYSDAGCNVRLMKTQVAKELNLYGDQHRFLPLLAYELGYIPVEVELKQDHENVARGQHNPGVYLRRMLDLLTIIFLTKFNKKPLRFFGILGTSAMMMGFLGLVYMTYEKLFLDVGMADRPLLVLMSLFLVLGIQLIGIGLIGETIIFTHADQNKEYRIKRIIN